MLVFYGLVFNSYWLFPYSSPPWWMEPFLSPQPAETHLLCWCPTSPDVLSPQLPEKLDKDKEDDRISSDPRAKETILDLKILTL